MIQLRNTKNNVRPEIWKEEVKRQDLKGLSRPFTSLSSIVTFFFRPGRVSTTSNSVLQHGYIRRLCAPGAS